MTRITFSQCETEVFIKDCVMKFVTLFFGRNTKNNLQPHLVIKNYWIQMPKRKAQFLERFVAKLCINTIKITLPTDKFQCHFSWQDVEYCLQVLSQLRLRMHQHCIIMLNMILNNLQINLFVFQINLPMQLFRF